MTKNRKTIIIVAVSAAAAAGLIFGGIMLAKKLTAGNAKVYSATDIIMTDYYEDSITYSGYVTADKIQSIYKSDTQQIKEVLVSQGQEVKTGDVILTYDTTLTDIELKKAALEVQKLQLQLEAAKKELEVINTYKPYVEPESETDEESEDFSDETDESDEAHYTAEEIAQMKAEKQKEIKDTDVAMRLAQVEYEHQQAEAGDGNVYAEIDGVVTSVKADDTTATSGDPIVTISGGGGYYIKAQVGELDLADMEIGGTMETTDWESGNTYEGTITEISDTPSSEEGYTNGNQNVSYYDVMVFIDGSASLQEGQYMDLTYVSSTSEDSIYLMNAFILTENGKNYVYVRGDDGLLEKRQVSTGKVVWGEYTQINEGISESDYIVFPYGAAIKEGAKTEEAAIDELYEY